MRYKEIMKKELIFVTKCIRARTLSTPMPAAFI